MHRKYENLSSGYVKNKGTDQLHVSQGVKLRMVLVVGFFEFSKIILFCSVIALYDLVQDVETMHVLC